MAQLTNISLQMQPQQRFVMNQSMHIAFQVLQMHIADLRDWLISEIEKNPLLQISSNTLYDPTTMLATTVADQPSSYQTIVQQVQEYFNTPQEQHLATYIAGCLNEKGFLTLIPEELCKLCKVSLAVVNKVLYHFQRMEPYGLGTQGVQEALLIQLDMHKLKHSMLYVMISDHFEDFLHQRFKKLGRYFQCSHTAIATLIQQHLTLLNPFPGHHFQSAHPIAIQPDIIIAEENNTIQVTIAKDDLPQFTIQDSLGERLDLATAPRDLRRYVRRHLCAARKLSDIIANRHDTLYTLVQCILKKQLLFLIGQQEAPNPMTMQELARAMHRSESTITRAIANKYLQAPIGTLKLRDLFTPPVHTTQGNISNKKAKDLILKLINNEATPLSDQQLSDLLKKQGISCSRRTVTKYRQQLQIAASSYRKQWKTPL